MQGLSLCAFAQTDWNIISGSQTAAIAGHVPTSVEELNAIGILGENIIKEYGERLVKNINAFVESNNLRKYLDRRPPNKRPMPPAKTPAKQQKTPPKKENDCHDEFDVDIDYSLIDMT